MNEKLTEGSQNSQRSRLLRFLTQTQLIDSLDTEHVGFPFGQTTDHKPADTESHDKTTRDQMLKAINITEHIVILNCVTNVLGALVRFVIG